MNNKRLIDLPIEEARAVKWQRGREKYGPDFVGDPLEELDGEMLDSLNYIDEAERRGLYLADVRAAVLGICSAVRQEYRQRVTA